MLPPRAVATKKKRWCGAWVLGALLGVVAGCTPAGPRALLDGKKLIEKSRYDAAIERLKVATELMETNALAWNYLGLAYHHAHQPGKAVEAYERALKRNPDLLEIYYDLGCVRLEEGGPGQLESARNEFTAYTLRKPKSAEGWLKLGTTQLRLGALADAERSLNEVRMLHPENAEALDDLGVISMRRKQAREAEAYFAAALRQQPAYAPALLNLAVVYQSRMNDRRLALEKYREYLALNPRPANWEPVDAEMRQLEQELNPPAASPPPRPALSAKLARVQSPAPVRVAQESPKPAPQPKPPPQTFVKPEVVQAADTANIKAAQGAPQETNVSTPAASASPEQTQNDPVVLPPADSDTQSEPARRGFFQKINPMNLLRRDPKPTDVPPTAPDSSATAPLNSDRTGASTMNQGAAQPQQFPRYAYRSLAAPATGDRAEADRLLALGSQAYHDQRLADAETAYRAATRADPGYFQAQSDFGLAAFEAGDIPTALSAYETALAINPGSFNARFNFALALKQAGYFQDAALELERLLANAPLTEARSRLANAHLTLANLYAEQFHQPAAARPHYLKVLDLDSANSQATAIRYWLRDNP